MQGLTAVSLIRMGHTVQKSDWIVIHAAVGSSGLIAAQLTHHLGPHVIGPVSTEEKVALIKAAGAEHVVLIKNGHGALEKMVHEVTNGQGVHTVLDSIGQESFESSLNIFRRMGTMALCDNYKYTRSRFDGLYGELAEYLAKGQLKVHVHNKVFALDEAQQARLDLEDCKSPGKLLIKIA
ncbi:NADPH:quinone reductase [Linnemannia hyalina]|uniref:NADPH:quinone reductase n=1 Tax=Linnemannia hyalina TaxID=64524 RepID=A0A9P8BVK4_9FUNG|nr:NADPH:quinone reductase [Linnemannia hyalina]